MLSVVDDVRGFNRFYTRVLGLLRPDLAGSAFGLTEARVLFELLCSFIGITARVFRLARSVDPGGCSSFSCSGRTVYFGGLACSCWQGQRARRTRFRMHVAGGS